MSMWRQWVIGKELYSSKGSSDKSSLGPFPGVVWASGLRRGHTLHSDTQPRSSISRKNHVIGCNCLHCRRARAPLEVLVRTRGTPKNCTVDVTVAVTVKVNATTTITITTMAESLRFLGSLQGHSNWVTAIATSSETPDVILTASRGNFSFFSKYTFAYLG
jgi:hypothetical protein